MVASTSKFKYIVCDPELCIGCQLCEYICSYTKTGEFNSYRSRIRTVRVDEVLITAVSCRTCENAPCVIACTRDALTQDSETGIIHIDPQKKLAEICNQCEDIEDGPQCVKICPKDALEYTTPDQRSQRTRHKLIANNLKFPQKAKDPR